MRRTRALRRGWAALGVGLVLAASALVGPQAWADSSGASSGSSGAASGAGGNANSAVAVNTKDGSSVFRIAFSVARVTGSTASPTNTAVAFASCSNCETVAIAIQVVLVVGAANVVAPTNQAIAYNYACSSCDTLASAYQDLVMMSGPVHFSAVGNQELAAVRRQLEELRNADLTFADLQAKVSALEQQVGQIVATQLVTGPAPSESTGASTSTTTSTSAPTSTAIPGGSSTTSTTAATGSTSTSSTSSSTTTSSTTATTTPTSTSTTP